MPDFPPLVNLAIAGVLAIVIAIVITGLVAFGLGLVGKRKEWPAALIARARIPFRITLMLAIVWAAVEATLPSEDWRAGLALAFRIAFIAAAAWLVAGVAIFFEDLGLGRYRVDVPDNRVARRIRTQVLIIRRLTVAVIVILAIGAILLSFPGVEAVGASVLASAGLISVIAGLAAQSTLANVFAGMQLAFSDAIRVDDVVVVEEEWGRIEEITLTYVVVHIWDDRRLVLPSTYFTSNPFENWTRHSSELLGAVELDLDWQISPDEMRAELDRQLAATDLFDGRTSVLQVTDAVGGLVRVRILVTAVDAPTLFDLRCHVREGMVRWITDQYPQSVPRQRVELGEPPETAHGTTSRSGSRTATRTGKAPAALATGEIPGLFTGDARAAERRGQLTGAIPIVRGRALTAPIEVTRSKTDADADADADVVEPRSDLGRGDS